MTLQDELGLIKAIENPAHETVISIVLTGGRLTKEGDRLLRPFKLTDSQFNVLMLLKHQSGPDGMSQTKLGKMLLVNRSNVTGLIDRMEQAGWVERVDEADDRRVKRVRLTNSGRKLLEKAEKAYFKRVEEVMGPLEPGQIQALTRLLAEIRSRLD